MRLNVCAAKMLSLCRVVRHGMLLAQPSRLLSSGTIEMPASSNKKTASPGTELENKAESDDLCRMMEVEVRGHDPAVLKSYEWFALEAAKELDICVDKTWIPPKHIWRRAVLKSAFVHKKHQVQYEIRTYFRVIQLKYLTGSTASTYLEYIQRNLPEGVAMKVTKHTLQGMPEYMNPDHEA